MPTHARATACVTDGGLPRKSGLKRTNTTKTTPYHISLRTESSSPSEPNVISVHKHVLPLQHVCRFTTCFRKTQTNSLAGSARHTRLSAPRGRSKRAGRDSDSMHRTPHRLSRRSRGASGHASEKRMEPPGPRLHGPGAHSATAYALTPCRVASNTPVHMTTRASTVVPGGLSTWTFFHRPPRAGCTVRSLKKCRT